MLTCFTGIGTFFLAGGPAGCSFPAGFFSCAGGNRCDGLYSQIVLSFPRLHVQGTGPACRKRGVLS